MSMCYAVGTPTEVKIRRDVADNMEVVMRPLFIMRGFDRTKSGSFSEGFRLETSDIDMMLWLPDHYVISNLTQISLYRIPQQVLILMECVGIDLPPGSTRLRILTHLEDTEVDSICIVINGDKYILSSLFRTCYLAFTKYTDNFGSSYREHGPCTALSMNGLEIDKVYCFRSKHWPCVALPWIHRCQLKHWPPENVIYSIKKEGCHVVPISSSPLDPERNSEWRISFAVAERKLVYSMNHCQFLCYGMLKIFLKEVINADDKDPCLCSYFIKTLMFWAIQNDRLIEWTPCNLLWCFWTCFKLLISWVYRGECPNFFIPQNNMFRVKVVGHRQVTLFDQLHALYNEGSPCLLTSPSIGKYLKKSTLYRILTPSTEESKLFSGYFLDMCLFEEMNKLLGPYTSNREEFARAIIAVEQLQKTQRSSLQAITIQNILSKVLRNYSLMSRQNIVMSSNRKQTHLLNMMKLAVKIGCASEILYLALYYYGNCQYERSLRCLHTAQKKMTQPCVVYYESTNEELYRRAIAEYSINDRMRKFLIDEIILNVNYAYYIYELIPEQEACKTYGTGILMIPPFVMLHMLFVLTHHRLGDTVRSQQSLQDLHTLLLYDDEIHIPIFFKDMSWQILGICQQICGDYLGALNSFQCSLRQIPFHNIQTATMIRCLGIRRLLQNY